MAGPIRISILANGSQARREAATTSRALAGIGGSLKGGAAALGLTSLVAGVIGIGKNAVNLEAQFSKTMNVLRATTGATSAEMRQLSDLAMRMGADTVFSANDASKAMLELARGGIRPAQIQAGALQGTLTLAAAGELEMGEAANVAVKAMGQFNLAGRDMNSIAAALAGGANASSASVRDMSIALAQGGLAANSVGFSIQETTGILAAFSNAGLEGSDAGTSLKTMLDRLQPSTMKAETALIQLGAVTEEGRNRFLKANGEYKAAARIAEILAQGTERLSAAERKRLITQAFGSDAQRAATILAQEGAEGLRPLIKATSDQAAANKMAKANMEGTAGALERLQGAAETAQLRLGQKLAPMVTKVADVLANNLEPAMDKAIDAGETFANAVEPIVDILGSLVGVAREAAGFIDDVPGPVKEVAIQAGIASLVLPRLAGAVTSVTGAIGFNIARLKQLQAELTYTTTRTQLATTLMGRLGRAARGAAGLGGMVALAQGAQQADSAVGDLLMVGGSIATGFAVGGPIGAAVAGLGSGFLALKSHMDNVNQGWSEGEPEALAYADTLDKVTGAATKATRALIEQDLQQRGLIASGASLGLSTKTLVGAVMGNDKALRQVRNSWKDYGNILEGVESQRVKDFVQSLRYDLMQQGAAARNSAGVQERAQARVRQSVQQLAQTYRATPKQVRTIVRAVGTDDSRANVRALARQYNVTPKQIRTIFRVVNAARVKGEAKGVGRAIEDTGKVRPSNKWVGLLTADLNTGKRRAGQGGQGIADNIRSGTAKARPNLRPFTSIFTGNLSGLKGTASSGGNQIGSNLGAGIAGGISIWVGPIAAQAASAVRQAVAAAKAEAKIKSPSRVMRDEVGAQLGAGLVEGMRDKEREAKRGGRRLMAQVLKEITGGRDGVRDALAAISKVIGKRKQLRASYRDEYRELLRNGAAQDRVTRKLEKARQKLQQLRQEANQYRNTIRSSIVDYGSVVGLGAIEGSSSVVSLKGLLSQLEARADAAKRYEALLNRLRAAGLNRTSIQDLLDAGVEGGLATAEAIAAGGASAITQINALTAQIGATGTRLGDKMTKAYHQAGIRAAEGLVRGLEKRQRQLDKVAERLAQSLVTKVKRALGIKSPSRVFQGIGDDVMAGLTLTLSETHARRIGSNVAGGLINGFGTPALDAYRLTNATAASRSTVSVRLTADQVSQLQRGREIQADLDAFRGSGGKGRTF